MGKALQDKDVSDVIVSRELSENALFPQIFSVHKKYCSEAGEDPDGGYMPVPLFQKCFDVRKMPVLR